MTPSLIRLLTFLSPAFPTGAFAYSHGIEHAVETNVITNGPTLKAWLTNVIEHGTGRADTILLRHAHRAGHDPGTLKALADLAHASAAARERLAESKNMGRAFIAAATVWGTPDLPEDPPYAVAVGATAAYHRVAEDDVAGAFLQSFAASLISAAVRLVPLGQTTGLQTLAALENTILATLDATKHATLDDLGGCAFLSDLAAMRHETQYTRLFRS